MTKDTSNSLLNAGLPFDEADIESILDDVEKTIRNLCYAMQLVHADCDGSSASGDYDRLSSACNTFYTLIDAQMDTIQRLRSGLDPLQGLSLNSLRSSDNFRGEPMPREAFTSEAAYREHLASFGTESSHA